MLSIYHNFAFITYLSLSLTNKNVNKKNKYTARMTDGLDKKERQLYVTKNSSIYEDYFQGKNCYCLKFEKARHIF